MLSDDAYFKLTCLSRGLLNTSTLVRRNFDGGVYSTKQSGTHWVRHLLGLVLADLHRLPPPEHINSRRIVGHHNTVPDNPGVPAIITTHSIANMALRLPAVFNLTKRPRYVFLVRDMRAVLVSAYEKYHHQGDVDFSTFLRGDVRNRKTYICDIWELIRYYNHWGPILTRFPDRCMVVKYEDLKADTRGELRRMCEHFGIEGVTDAVLDRAIAGASKHEMSRRLDPSEPEFQRVVRLEEKPFLEWYSAEDHAFVQSVLARHLHYEFGYRYLDPPQAAAA